MRSITLRSRPSVRWRSWLGVSSLSTITRSTSSAVQRSGPRLSTLPLPMNVAGSGERRSWSVVNATVAPAASARPASSRSDASAGRARLRQTGHDANQRSALGGWRGRTTGGHDEKGSSEILAYNRAHGPMSRKTTTRCAAAAARAAAEEDRRRARGQDQAPLARAQAQGQAARTDHWRPEYWSPATPLILIHRSDGLQRTRVGHHAPARRSPTPSARRRRPRRRRACSAPPPGPRSPPTRRPIRRATRRSGSRSSRRVPPTGITAPAAVKAAVVAMPMPAPTTADRRDQRPLVALDANHGQRRRRHHEAGRDHHLRRRPVAAPPTASWLPAPPTGPASRTARPRAAWPRWRS